MTANPGADESGLENNPPQAGKDWGFWTKQKLQILEDYLQGFATASKTTRDRIYLDLFAGWPTNVSRETSEPLLGSVHRALGARPPFTRLCLFELPPKAERLEAEVRRAYPGRPGIAVYPGNCNETIDQALQDLWSARFAPTFAFIDQFAAEVHWTTLEKISRFRDGRTKAELWILFATGQYPRGLNIHGGVINARYGGAVTAMLGSDQWWDIAVARRDQKLTAAEARAEWVNLMRWRLENRLGYAVTYPFTMRNTGGHEIYDMIFATDHPAGDRIMRSVYGTAAARQPSMRRHAQAVRKDRRKQAQGEEALFPLTEAMVSAPPQSYEPPRVREPYRLPEE